MRFVPVAQRIDVRVAARQQDAVQSFDNGIDVLGIWDQADVYRSAAGGFDCFTVVARQVEPVGREFNAHRDADARPLFRHSGNIITQVADRYRP